MLFQWAGHAAARPRLALVEAMVFDAAVDVRGCGRYRALSWTHVHVIRPVVSCSFKVVRLFFSAVDLLGGVCRPVEYLSSSSLVSRVARRAVVE